jgi:pyruvate/oxaloacetate carboxyltransferase
MSDIKFQVTYRDSGQSNAGSKIPAEEELAATASVLSAGYASSQDWGGTYPHVAIKNGRDPFDELRQKKAARQHIPISMLLRGQSACGYTNYPDDVVQAFTKQSARNGVDIFTIFDALNYVPNMATAIEAALNANAKVQGTVCIGNGPNLTMQHYYDTAHQLNELGVHELYVKDPCGIVRPKQMKQVVSMLKEQFGLPVHVHMHNTHNLAPLSYLAAIEAGADCIDILPEVLADGTAQPSDVLMYNLIKNHPDPDIVKRLTDIDFAAVNTDREAQLILRQLYSGNEVAFDPRLFRAIEASQSAGGGVGPLWPMIESSFKSSGLSRNDALTRVYEAKASTLMPMLGYPLQVTPVEKEATTYAGFITIAELNGIQGNKRFELMNPGMVDYLTGWLGQSVAVADDYLVGLAREKQTKTPGAISDRPANHLEPSMPAAYQKLRENGIDNPTEEDAVLVAMFGDKNEGLNHVLAKNNRELEQAAAPSSPIILSRNDKEKGHKIGVVNKLGAASIEQFAQDVLWIAKYESGAFDSEQDFVNEVYDEQFKEKLERINGFYSDLEAYLEAVQERGVLAYEWTCSAVTDILKTACDKKFDGSFDIVTADLPRLNDKMEPLVLSSDLSEAPLEELNAAAE